MGKVSVIVVTYNRLSLLKECIENLLNQNISLDTIFVINNNSSDGTKEYLNEISSTTVVKPIHLKENIGGAGGFSYGLKCAYEQSQSDYFLIMDDDTMCKKDTISELVIKADQLDFGFLCSDVRWYKNNSACLLNCPEVERDWNEDLNDGLVKVKTASFVSFMVSRDMVKKIGLPISEMFIWADDVEFSTRLSTQKNSFLVTNSTVVHKCKTNNVDESINNCDENRIFYYECMYRNRMYIYRKHYGLRFRLLYFIDYLLKSVMVPFKSHDLRFKRLRAVLIGTFKGMFFNPKIKFPND